MLFTNYCYKKNEEKNFSYMRNEGLAVNDVTSVNDIPVIIIIDRIPRTSSVAIGNENLRWKMQNLELTKIRRSISRYFPTRNETDTARA